MQPPFSAFRQAAPLTVLGFAWVVVLIATVLTALLLMRSPWLGGELGLPEEGAGLVIDSVSTGGPLEASGLRAGDRIIELLGDEYRIALQAVDLIVDPGLQPSYRDYHHFFSRQGRLWEALHDKPVRLVTDAGQVFSVPVGQHRPLSDLPWEFWFQVFCGSVAFMAGVLVSAFRRQNIAATYYLMTGIGITLVIFSNAGFSSRELALSPDVFLVLSKINWLGVCTLGWGLIGTLWYYPNRLSDTALFGRILAGVYVAMLLWDWLEIPDSLEVGQRYPLYAGFVSAALLAFLQWRRLKDDPVGRAALRWFIFSWFAGTGAFIVMVLLPISLGLGTGVNYILALGLLPLLQLGIALGIMRYRLFDLDRWAMLVWLWFVGGLVVILADSILIYILQLNAALALSISLLAVGWIYFPLRQYLWGRLGWSREKVNYEELFPSVLHSILSVDSVEQVQKSWEKVLTDIYRPLSLRDVEQKDVQLEIINDGLSIRIPGFSRSSALELAGADGGARLFGPSDQSLIEALWRLFHDVQVYRDAFNEGEKAERRRVARDLHDDIAADLLAMIYDAPDESSRSRAHRTFSELRAIIQGMNNEQRSLGECHPEWEADARERCQSAGIRLEWQSEIADSVSLSSRSIMNLRRVLREAVSNVIKHSGARKLKVRIEQSHEIPGLKISIEDDGQGLQDGRSTGSGMSNMRSRIDELGGRVEWVSGLGDSASMGTAISIFIPLKQGGGIPPHSAQQTTASR